MWVVREEECGKGVPHGFEKVGGENKREYEGGAENCSRREGIRKVGS